jgi:hypothetical protein
VLPECGWGVNELWLETRLEEKGDDVSLEILFFLQFSFFFFFSKMETP